MKLNGYYATQKNLFFVFSRCSLYIEVMIGQSFTKQRRIVRLTAFLSRHTTSFQRLYYVYTTSATSYRRLLDIEKTSCVYWVAFEREWKMDTWKSQSENIQWKVQCMVHKNNMKITVSVSWCPYNLAYGISQLACIYMLLYFWHFYLKKTPSIFFLIVLYALLFAAINTRSLY